MGDEVVIHVFLLSQPSRALYMICKLLGIQHRVNILNMSAGDHKSEAFSKINPFKKVPSMQDGPITINESCAAIRHLAAKYDKTGQWYPSDEVLRARTDEYLAWQHTNTRKHGVGVFYNKFLAPKYTGKPADMELVNQHMQDLKVVEKNILSYFLKSSPFIGGDKPSIADIIACCELEQPIKTGHEMSDGIKSYMARVKSETGEVYSSAHKLLWDLKVE